MGHSEVDQVQQYMQSLQQRQRRQIEQQAASERSGHTTATWAAQAQLVAIAQRPQSSLVEVAQAMARAAQVSLPTPARSGATVEAMRPTMPNTTQAKPLHKRPKRRQPIHLTPAALQQLPKTVADIYGIAKEIDTQAVTLKHTLATQAHLQHYSALISLGQNVAWYLRSFVVELAHADDAADLGQKAVAKHTRRMHTHAQDVATMFATLLKSAPAPLAAAPARPRRTTQSTAAQYATKMRDHVVIIRGLGIKIKRDLDLLPQRHVQPYQCAVMRTASSVVATVTPSQSTSTP